MRKSEIIIMQRPLEVGDFVESIDEPREYFTISKITPDNIYIGLNEIPLFAINGKWRSPDGRNVIFKNKETFDYKMFSENPLVDINILFYLSDEDLGKACVVNTYLNGLCNENSLWLKKLEKTFPDAPHVIKNLNYKDVYILLKKIKFGIFQTSNLTGASVLPIDIDEDDRIRILDWVESYDKFSIYVYSANDAAFRGYIKILDWLEKRFYLPDQDGANLAAGNGKIESLNWMKRKSLPLPDQNGINFAAEYGRISVLDWAINLHGYTIRPDADGWSNAVINGQIEVLEWGKTKMNMIYSEMESFYAISNNQLKVLIWLKDNNPEFKLTESNFKQACLIPDNFKMIKWMIQNYFPVISNNMFNSAINSNVEILEYIKGLSSNDKRQLPDNERQLLGNERQIPNSENTESSISKNILSDTGSLKNLSSAQSYTIWDNTIYDVITDGKLSNLIWIKENFPKFKFTQKHVNYAAFEGQFEIIIWFINYSLVPDQDGINGAGINDKLYIIKFLENKGHKRTLDQFGINQVASEGHIDILEYMDTKQIWPDQDGANFALGNGKIKTVKWINNVIHIKPNTYGANMAAENGNFKALVWAHKKYNIIPDWIGKMKARENGYDDIVTWIEYNTTGNEFSARE